MNYLPSQQAAVDLFNKGQGSDDFKKALWVFVPRALVPSKPVLTASGLDLNEKVTGFRNSSTGIGVYVDGYYMLGWLGVLLASFTYALVLRFYAVIARSIVTSRALLMYPLVFLGIYAGLRSDGWWLTDIAGPAVLVLFVFSIFTTLAHR